MAELPIQLEAAKDCSRNAAGSPALTGSERQVIDSPELQVVLAIVDRQGPISEEVRWIGERCASRTRPGSVVLVVHRFRPRIDEPELRRATREPRQLRLQSVVIRGEDGLVHRDPARVVTDGAGGGGAVLEVDGFVRGEIARV